MTIEQQPADAILDRSAGCLIGLAVGDALGGPVENLSAAEIADHYGRLEEMAGGGHLNLRPGETTDDTAQVIAISESIADCRRFDPGDVSNRLVAWFNSNPKGAGAHTTAVLSKAAQGGDWEMAALETQAKNPLNASNGSLMRCAPVALLDHAVISVLIEDSRLSSRITHPHAECQWSCAFLNLVIAELISGTGPIRAVDNALGTCGHRGDAVHEVLTRSKQAASNPKPDGLSPTGYVLDTLQCAIWAFLHSYSFESALIRAVNLGGDADTIGAVTGAMAGAAYGLKNIPDRWLAHINALERLRELSETIINIY